MSEEWPGNRHQIMAMLEESIAMFLEYFENSNGTSHN